VKEIHRTESSIDDLALIVWDYMHMKQPLEKADLIFVLGSHDIRVAQWAAQLYLRGFAPRVLFSGNEGIGRKISGFEGTPEAERFAQISIEMGVPESAILKEVEATNTGENIVYSAELLKKLGLPIRKMIVVQKPYMERRTFATIAAQWPKPQPSFIISSPEISYQEYISNPIYPKDYTLNVMVGDLQRIKEYPKLGYQIEQDIPDEVWSAYEELVRRGYTDHLLK